MRRRARVQRDCFTPVERAAGESIRLAYATIL
jgi:hypothetical protein